MTPNGPAWWLLRLGQRLEADRNRFDLLESYHRGDPPVPFGNRKMREAYRRLQKQARSNFAGLVAETLLERMKVVGFRAGGQATDEADREAWGWWQANNLDSVHSRVQRAAVVMSRSYVIVAPDSKDESKPKVTGEDPRQVIHESDPTDDRQVRAALKTWWDDVEAVHKAVVYLPGTIHYFQTASMVKQDTPNIWASSKWELDTGRFETALAPNKLGCVPVVPFINRPNLAGEGLGEFEDVTDVLDRINTVVLDRLVISAMQAYRQRWAKGVDLEDEDGNVQSVFDPGADLLWAVPNETAAFGEFSATDVGPIIKAAEADIQHLAAITRTPPHYLIGAVVNVSGDALAAAETGLVSKCVERTTEFGESWEQVYRLAGKVSGKDIADDAEVIWKDPESHTMAELADAGVKFATVGVPWRTRMSMIGKTPSEIDRMEMERAHDAMLAQSLAPLPVAEGGEVGSRGVSFKAGALDGSTPDTTTPNSQSQPPPVPAG